MAGNLIPKSMSLEEARDYVSDARNWQPDMTGQDELDFSPGEEVLYDAEQPESEPADTQYLHVETPIEDESPRDQLRTDELVEQDIDYVCGVRAVSTPAEFRHEATLRLIEDLIDARGMLADLTAIVSAVGKR